MGANRNGGDDQMEALAETAREAMTRIAAEPASILAASGWFGALSTTKQALGVLGAAVALGVLLGALGSGAVGKIVETPDVLADHGVRITALEADMAQDRATREQRRNEDSETMNNLSAQITTVRADLRRIEDMLYRLYCESYEEECRAVLTPR